MRSSNRQLEWINGKRYKQKSAIQLVFVVFRSMKLNMNIKNKNIIMMGGDVDKRLC